MAESGEVEDGYYDDLGNWVSGGDDTAEENTNASRRSLRGLGRVRSPGKHCRQLSPRPSRRRLVELAPKGTRARRRLEAMVEEAAKTVAGMAAAEAEGKEPASIDYFDDATDLSPVARVEQTGAIQVFETLDGTNAGLDPTTDESAATFLGRSSVDEVFALFDCVAGDSLPPLPAGEEGAFESDVSDAPDLAEEKAGLDGNMEARYAWTTAEVVLARHQLQPDDFCIADAQEMEEAQEAALAGVHLG